MDITLHVEKLNKFYGKRKVLSDVTFDVLAGEIVGLVGPNGAGKTTVMKCCVGLLKKIDGDIFVCGKSIKTQFESAISQISYMSDSGNFYDYLSGYDNLKLYARLFGKFDKNRIEEIIKFVGMQDRMHEPVKNYSLGMKQRMSLALTAINDPKIILMDEPLNGLDPEGIVQIREFITRLARDKNVSFLVSSHNLNEVEKLCGRTIVINNGMLRRELKSDGILRSTFQLGTNDIPKTELIIKKLFETEVTNTDGLLTFVIKQQDIDKLMKTLIGNGIEIRLINTVNTLETEYMNMFGGGDGSIK